MQTKYQSREKLTLNGETVSVRRDGSSGAAQLLKESGESQAVPPSPLSVVASKRLIVLDPHCANRAAFESSRPGSRTYTFWKRTLDMTLGSILLIVAVPIVLVAALAIRIDTPGSPFFFQKRLGRDGKPFKIFKLRGMYIDARTRFPTYYDYSHKRDLEFCFHHEEDPRVTRAGKFIRRTSIDELPNLWNVVLGDMSLVGPRPEIPDVLALYGPYRNEYLSVKPGITCLSKCTGRDRLTKRETIEFDLGYIRQRSFNFDFRILWKTFRSVLLRRDVF